MTLVLNVCYLQLCLCIAGCHRENEIFDLCPPTCPPQNCGVNQSIICFVPNPEPGSPLCKPSCRCKGGYLRNEKKECVLPEQCGM